MMLWASCIKIMSKKFSVKTLEETAVVGATIAEILSFPKCIYLDGAMGAGKTTLTASILAGLGYKGSVTSPTYNLVQEYQIGQGTVYHMDLYRLEEPDELEYLAIDDLWTEESIFIIEWPSKGVGFLPKADISISIATYTKDDQEYREIIVADGSD